MQTSLRELSTQLAKQLDDLPDDQAIVDVFDYLAGVVYSLKRLEGVPVWNRRGERLPGYKKRVSLYLSRIPEGEEPNAYWTSGYFLNSAMLRVAACYDRIPKLLLSPGARKKGNAHSRMESFLGAGTACSNWRNIYCEVNALKHKRQGLAAGRRVTRDQVIEALAEIVSTLEERKSQLKTLG